MAHLLKLGLFIDSEPIIPKKVVCLEQPANFDCRDLLSFSIFPHKFSACYCYFIMHSQSAMSIQSFDT